MYYSIEHMKQFFQFIPQNSSLYEFGVCTGNSIAKFLQDSIENNRPFNKIYGFDSFEGLPTEADGIWCSPDWKPGVFNVVKEFNLNTKEEAKQKLMNKFYPYTNTTPVEFIDGWYKDTLTNELAQKLKSNPAGFLHIDTDLYISAKEALNWIFANKLLLPGAIIRYDDWYSTPEFTAGESLAHIETCVKYNLQMSRDGNVFQYIGD